ncbi:segregation and condensation protein A [Hyphobacterium marinum]|uniref:Segregation and condensation protein A n=1 Tax=Hyphobacterium marinum TaxID=3116574 RepID=A0ABU7M1E9_9PROT|nr:ScpA family protein [Hyphobacterium sp. Y6023]MEE2567621.1 ScpA family protein [Hyphobacterium sp. Y6023]
MTEEFEEDLPFKAAEDADDEALIVDVDGYEGPLHLLLALARKKKVDLAKISILELAEQYLTFVAEARRKRLDLAAEYLVMASWLAYLKSRLLLPKPVKDDEPEPEALAASLAFRLRRLEAMRLAAEGLFQRDLLKRDLFVRGAPEGVRTLRAAKYEADLHDLLRAYATRRQSRMRHDYKPNLPKVYGLETARERLETLLPEIRDWRNLEDILPEARELGSDPPPRRSVLASSTLAALEVTKEGRAELRQDKAFAPIKVRGRDEKKPQ